MKWVGLVGLLTFLLIVPFVYSAVVGECPSGGECFDDNSCGVMTYYIDPFDGRYVYDFVQGESCQSGYQCVIAECIIVVPNCHTEDGEIPCGGTNTCIRPNETTRKNCTLSQSITVMGTGNRYYFDNLVIPAGKTLNFVSPSTQYASPSANGGQGGAGGNSDDGGGSAGYGGKGGNTARLGTVGSSGSDGGAGIQGIPGAVVVIDALRSGTFITVNGYLSANGKRGGYGGSATGNTCSFWNCKGKGGGGGGPGGGGGSLIIQTYRINGSGYINALGGSGGEGGAGTDESGDRCGTDEDYGGSGGGGGGGGGGIVSISANYNSGFGSGSSQKKCDGGSGGLGGCNFRYPSAFVGETGDDGYNGNCDATSSLPEICNNGMDDDGDFAIDHNDTNCQVCGNNYVDPGEECDDGNNNPNDNCFQCNSTCAAFSTVTYKNTNYQVIAGSNGCYQYTCNGIFRIPVITVEAPLSLCDSNPGNGDCYCDGVCTSGPQEGKCGATNINVTANNHYCSAGDCESYNTRIPCCTEEVCVIDLKSPEVNDAIIGEYINFEDDSMLGTASRNKDTRTNIELFDVINYHCSCNGGLYDCDTGYDYMWYDTCPSECRCSDQCTTPVTKYYCSNPQRICQAGSSGKSGMCMPASTPGVYLNKTRYSDNTAYFKCGVADGICPDDFSDKTPGQCGALNGICKQNNIADPDCSVCGNGVINSGEVCDGTNFGNKSCSTYGFNYGSLSCQNGCTYINTSGCYYNVTNVAYSLGKGCNPTLKTCGRDSIINVTVSVPGAINISIGTQGTVKLKGKIADPYAPECNIPNIQTTLTSVKSNSITYSYNITAAAVQSGTCNQFPLMNNTYDSKLLRPGGAPASNTFNNVFDGFRLNDCGDGVVDYYPDAVPPYVEECDGTNLNNQTCITRGFNGGNLSCYPSGYGAQQCKFNITACSTCGDGIREDPEQCDLGADLNGLGLNCSDTCTFTYCGNGLTEHPNGKAYATSHNPPPFSAFNEQCDDGDLNNTNRCYNNCTQSFCGDGITNTPNYAGLSETCDNGTLNNNSKLCNLNCGVTYCGDGVKQNPNGQRTGGVYGTDGTWSYGFENCDDGNTNSSDRCYSNCTLTFCGDGIVQYPNGYGQWENCEPSLTPKGLPCDPISCRMSECGNNIVEIGEECDDGGRCSEGGNWCASKDDCEGGASDKCLPVDGDGCSAGCFWTDCVINSINVSCPGGVCGMGDWINISFRHSGAHCNLSNAIQVDYFRVPSKQGYCKIEWDNSSGGMRGMASSFNNATNPYKFNYLVRSIPEECAGATLNYVDAALYYAVSGIIITPRSEVYTYSVNSTTFDQCRQYGVVSNYTNYNVSLGYKVITNSDTGCLYQTCNNYDANLVKFLETTDGKYGVILTNDSGIDVSYLCNANVEDYICPDDFEYHSKCKVTGDGSGVCSENGARDADCEIKTPMKCGTVWNGTMFINSCTVPTPTPMKYCTDSAMCVYANETNGSNKNCYSFKTSVINNSANNIIQCVEQNTWCPYGYSFNGTRCINTVPMCSNNCTLAINVSMIQSKDKKSSPAWNAYLNNSNCFGFDPATKRRVSYCGVRSVWPVVQYYMLPVGVVYWVYNPLTGEYDQVSDQ